MGTPDPGEPKPPGPLTDRTNPIGEGGCLCAKVRYAVFADPVRTTHCHCRFCQRATGAAYHVAHVFPQDRFAVTRGQPKTYTHHSDGSGMAIEVRFCGDCGCRIFLSLERFPGTVAVYGGSFDDPNHFAVRFPVTKQIFLSSGRHGTIVPAGVESYWGHAVDDNDQPLGSTIFDEPIVLCALTIAVRDTE